MAKMKSSINITKKKSENKTDNSRKGNVYNDNKKEEKTAGSPGVQVTRRGNKAKSSKGSSMYILFFGLSVVIATAAIIFTNEDVQMYLVKLTYLGSNPLQHIVQSEDNYAQENIQNSAQQHSSVKSPGVEDSSQDANDNKDKTQLDNSGGETSQIPNVKQKQDSATGSKTTNDKKSNVKKKDTGGSKSKEEEKIKNSSLNENERQKSDNGEGDGVKKVKPKRKDYMKYNITSREDYKIRKKLDAADEMLEEDNLTGSMQKFDAILKTNPESPRALWGKALVNDRLAEKQRSNQMLEEGMKLMDQAMRLSQTPAHLVATIAKKLAERQTFRGWTGKAAATWRYLVSKFPDNLEFKYKFGVSFLMVGKIESARDVFKQILEKYPDDGFALTHLGFIIKTNDGNNEEAIPLLQRGIDSNVPGTSDGRFFYHLGDAYSRVNQTDKAYEIYQIGADRGLFLSPQQRSLYNADTPITGRPWWTPEQTTYKKDLKLLAKSWKTIREEGLAQMDLKKGSFLAEEENLREKGDWKQFVLYQRGKKNEENCKKAPKTCALIDQIPDAGGCTRGQVKFSVMHPGVHVWPHTGPTNCRLRAHLGLVVPEGPRIRVGNDMGTWKEGEFIIFDDSFEHEVWHDGKEFRLVLIVDFWHPELTQHQKRTMAPI